MLLLLLLSRFSRVRLCATPQTAAHQAPLSLGFSRQEYRSGCHFLLQCVKVKSPSRVRLSATPWTAAYQASSSMGFSRQESWSGVPLPSQWRTIGSQNRVVLKLGQSHTLKHCQQWANIWVRGLPPAQPIEGDRPSCKF